MGKIYKMSETSNQYNILSGIYKLNFPNGKCYIGLSNNIRKRVWTHNHNDYKLNRVVGNAINKYGQLTEFEVLEEIPKEQRSLMNQRQQYWIKYYHSNEKEYGYNMTKGGDGGSTGSGINNSNAAFNQQQLNEILFLLKNKKELSMQEIAKIYNVNKDTILKINRGETYIQPNLSYPIRTQQESNKNLLTGTKSSSSKLNEKELKEIINLIQNSNLNFSSIAQKYNISPSTIGLINKGKRYYNDNYIYPLRDKNKVKQIQYKRM